MTVNSLTARPGKVNVSGRRTSARRIRPSPEFLTRSSTRDGWATSSWWVVSTFQTAQVELSLASLGSAPILASIWSRQVILRHRAIKTEIHSAATTIIAATTAATSFGWLRSVINSQLYSQTPLSALR